MLEPRPRPQYLFKMYYVQSGLDILKGTNDKLQQRVSGGGINSGHFFFS